MAYPDWQGTTATRQEHSPWWFSAGLVGIAIVALLLRLIGVGRYPGLIYDEYYYVPAADVLLHRTPPVLVKNMVPGIDPNLLSHPPLAKELIAASIYLLGNHPWVWRLPGVLLGTLAPLFIAGIAWELFHHRGISLMAALLGAADGLMITMSRVALPDSTAVPLVLLALWVLVRIMGRVIRHERVAKGSWVALGVTLGLALAAEWIGGQAILLGWLACFMQPRVRKAWRNWLLATTIIPFFVYFLTYAYSWPHGFQQRWLPHNPIVGFFRLQWLMLKDMWQLKFYHPWTANAWSWIGIPRPTALLLTVNQHHAIRMMAFSDPIIVWLGVASLILGIWVIRRRPRWQLAWIFLALWFVSFYGTWLLTPRSKFLYYFTTASAGLDIALAAGLIMAFEWSGQRARPFWGRSGTLAVAAVGGLSIVYLLPLWVGLATPRPLYHALWWPSSWNPRVKPKTVASRSPMASFSLTTTPRRGAVKGWSALSYPSDAPTIPTPWTVFRGAVGHNSVYRSSLKLKSGYALTLSHAGLVEAPTISGDMAYVGTNNDQLYAINWTTGKVRWAVSVPNMAMTAPLIDQGLVVIGVGNNAFRTYNSTQGWIRGTGSNAVMAFSAKTGRMVWSHPTVGEDMPTPVIDGTTVYEVTGDERLIALSLLTGKLLWSLPLLGFDSMSSPIIVGHQLYVATNLYLSSYPATSSRVWAINLATHHVSWSQALPVASGLSDCSIAYGNQTLLVSAVPHVANHGQSNQLSDRLYALDARTGRVVWSHSLGSGIINSLDQEEEGIPLVMGSLVYEGSPASHQLTAFHVHSGKRLWSVHLPTGITANPVMVGHTLLVAGMNGQLYGMNPENGKIVSRDPVKFGAIGPASPLIVSNALLQSTMTGQLVVQTIGP